MKIIQPARLAFTGLLFSLVKVFSLLLTSADSPLGLDPGKFSSYPHARTVRRLPDKSGQTYNLESKYFGLRLAAALLELGRIGIF